ncbi:MAG: hypothetical protein SV760_05550, partial [Halobacteria archaeon]|nr:hypothetical protein [Halobacteria archaeon]
MSDSERLPLALTAVGILVTFASVVGFVVGGSSAFVPSVAGIALGWFLVPFGVYREAEVLESENVL